MVTAKIPFLDLAKVADSGQAFRIKVIDSTHAELVAFGRYLQIAKTGPEEFAFSCSQDEFDTIWKAYFDLDRDYESIVKSINKNDKYLLSAAQFGKGIRILRQDVFETTISYIISQGAQYRRSRHPSRGFHASVAIRSWLPSFPDRSKNPFAANTMPFPIPVS